MKQFLFAFCCIVYSYSAKTQELFVLTEPASNMPAKSIGFRFMNTWGKDVQDNGISFHTMPELMLGISKQWMVHVQGFISNSIRPITVEGGSIYTKYRFFSSDQVHGHFRMAAYGRLSVNNSYIHQQEIETMGHNSGSELGLIATQLLHKVALSASISYENAWNNAAYKFPDTQPNAAINYSLSLGKLMLPKEYKSYQQTNLNLMLECLAQQLTNSQRYFIDLAPAIQIIVNSQARFDLAYRKQIAGNMLRSNPSMVVLKLEYTLFNALK